MDNLLSELLKDKMIQKNWTYDQMSSAIGVGRSNLHKWINDGVLPDTKNLVKIADGLGIGLGEIIDALEGRYIPMDEADREAIAICRRYKPESILRAAERVKGAKKNPQRGHKVWC